MVSITGFKSQYTTAELVSKESDAILADPKLVPVEADKIVLSNDFYMLGQYLECLINKLVR